jgi:hypothetical protein
MALLTLVLTFAAACSPMVIPVSPAAATVTPPTTTPVVATPSPDIGARLVVTMGSGTHCANFPYSCLAKLSVLPAGATVTDNWRPAASDPWWGADWTQGTSSDRFDPTPIGTVPRLPPGSHTILVSLLGSYDTPSYKPDGSIATDLLSRCSAEVVVGEETRIVSIRVTFAPDPQSFRAGCTIRTD